MSVFARAWKMSSKATHGLSNGEFTLQKHLADGFTYYTLADLKCAAGSEFDAWSNCKLVQRGCFIHPWAPLKTLDPQAASFAADLVTEINAWLKVTGSATLRLEGDLELLVQPGSPVAPASSGPPPTPAAGPESVMLISTLAVTMFVARDAVKNPDGSLRNLLILSVRGRDNGPVIVGGPDGSGTGDPKN